MSIGMGPRRSRGDVQGTLIENLPEEYPVLEVGRER